MGYNKMVPGLREEIMFPGPERMTLKRPASEAPDMLTRLGLVTPLRKRFHSEDATRNKDPNAAMKTFFTALEQRSKINPETHSEVTKGENVEKKAPIAQNKDTQEPTTKGAPSTGLVMALSFKPQHTITPAKPDTPHQVKTNGTDFTAKTTGVNAKRSDGAKADEHQPAETKAKTPKTSSSRYRGVCWLKKRKAWRSRIEVHGKREHLGYFDSEEKAAMAYDIRARELSGPNARVNFPIGQESKAQKDKQSTASRPAGKTAKKASGKTKQCKKQGAEPVPTSAPRPMEPILPAHQSILKPTFPLINTNKNSIASLQDQGHTKAKPEQQQLPFQTAIPEGSPLQNQLSNMLLLAEAHKSLTYLAPLNKWVVQFKIAGQSLFGGLFESEQLALASAVALLREALVLMKYQKQSLQNQFPQRSLFGEQCPPQQNHLHQQHLLPHTLPVLSSVLSDMQKSSAPPPKTLSELDVAGSKPLAMANYL
eukprot:CAMPEP_0184542456 /NCGR_PEP_ID=MMETSP0199_2-20130426/2056_1 /TAXON_ID=1112570 /ORGANISM="Thraustochytrium sp., Strain LLF1b" /LENGTH=480 /DNA_ID=CAMNT_0026936259 /DNA_START=461 /DNA_END=1903 /DNA_ORIENTATION=+